MCRSHPSSKIWKGLFAWAHCLVCDCDLVCVGDHARHCTHSSSQPGTFLNPEDCGKANGREREHAGPNCSLAGVVQKLCTQTVKRICVATLVRGPCNDVGSRKTETSGAAVP